MSIAPKQTNETTLVKSNRDINWGFHDGIQVASIGQSMSVIKRAVQE
jgi:hypothetical protein